MTQKQIQMTKWNMNNSRKSSKYPIYVDQKRNGKLTEVIWYFIRLDD